MTIYLSKKIMIENLKKELQAAVKAEEYEEAEKNCLKALNFFEEKFSNMKYKTILGDFFRNERQFHLACRYFVRINKTTC